MHVVCRRIMHRKKRMKQSWCNDQISFEPCAYYYHYSGNEHRQWFSSFFKNENENWYDHAHENSKPKDRSKFNCKQSSQMFCFWFFHLKCRNEVFIYIKIQIE